VRLTKVINNKYKKTSHLTSEKWYSDWSQQGDGRSQCQISNSNSTVTSDVPPFIAPARSRREPPAVGGSRHASVACHCHCQLPQAQHTIDSKTASCLGQRHGLQCQSLVSQFYESTVLRVEIFLLLCYKITFCGELVASIFTL